MRAAEIDDRGIAAADGAVSAPTWIQYTTGQHRTEATRSIRAGRAVRSLPAVRAAWESGHIAASAAHRIIAARRPGFEVQFASVEPHLVEFAQWREYQELHAALLHYKHCAASESGTSPREPEGLMLARVADTWVVNGSLDDATGTMLHTALEAASTAPAPDDTRTPAQRRAGALHDIARWFCATGRGESDHGNAPHITAIVDWATITSSAPDARHNFHGTPIEPALVHRLLCECNLTRVVTGPSGEVLDVGRTRRTPSRALRTAVIARDRHCRYPGCDRPASWSEIHHVVPWQHGGPTDLDNLVLLCSHHHHVIHKPRWICKLDGPDLVIVTPHGREFRSRPPRGRYRPALPSPP